MARYTLGAPRQPWHHPLYAMRSGNQSRWTILNVDTYDVYEIPHVLEKFNYTRSFDWPTVPLARRTKKPVQFSGGNPSSTSIHFVMDVSDFAIDQKVDLINEMRLCEMLGSHPLELYFGDGITWEVVMESVTFEVELWHPVTYNPTRVDVTMNFKERA